MRVDLSCQTLNLIEGNKLQISSKTGSPLTTVGLNPLFIKEKLPGAPEAKRSHFPSGPWIEVTLLSSDSTTSKTYLVSIDNLQSAINQEELKRGQAVITAAEAGNIGALRESLASGVIAQSHRGEAVIKAAQAGYEGIVTELLSGETPISVWARICSIALGVFHGYRGIVTDPLPHRATILEYDRGQAVLRAIENGHTGIVKKLLAHGAKISEDLRGEAVIKAIENGHPGVVTELLAHGAKISEDLRGEAVLRAIQYGHPGVVTELLAHGATLSEYYQGAAIIEAIEFGHPGVVTQLLAHGATLSESHRGAAIIKAIENGHPGVVTELLAHGAMISEDMRGEAVIKAIENGHPGVVTELLAHGATISEFHRGRAIIKAIENGHTEMVTLLGGEPGARPASLDRLCVKIDEFAENPELYLKRVTQEGLKPVTFINPDGTAQAGFDAGGLTRQFVCQLAEHLLAKGVIERNEQRLPLAKKPDLNPYVELGNLLSKIDLKNATSTDTLYIGEIFSEQTYGLLQMLAMPQMASESVEQKRQRDYIAIANTLFNLSDKAQQESWKELNNFLNRENPSKTEISLLKKFFEEALLDISPDITPNELKQFCFENMEVHHIHKALSAILEGLSPAIKTKILQQGVDIAQSIQGTIDQRLLNKFTTTSEDPVVIQKLTWLKEKIKAELEDPEKKWIKDFLRCVTGQSVMPNKMLDIQGTSSPMCHASTCFFRLFLSNTYETHPKELGPQERFFKSLQHLINEKSFELT